jgi:hypothetical protein
MTGQMDDETNEWKASRCPLLFVIQPMGIFVGHLSWNFLLTS